MTKHYDINWLTDSIERGDALEYIYFWGHTNKFNEAVGKFCFSQWYESPFSVDNKTYKTAEHWMMAQKALLFEDKTCFDKILAADKPAIAKDLGRLVLGFDEHIWNKHRFEIVKTGNIHKFNQNPIMADYLLKTDKHILVEASPVDSIWGIGLAQDDNYIDNIYAWRGLNLLGFALMEVRDFLQAFGHFTPLDNALQTPWTIYPNIDSRDLFWRMGKGEDCLTQFYAYYSKLTDREQTIFKLTNPAPYDWFNVYD